MALSALRVRSLLALLLAKLKVGKCHCRFERERRTLEVCLLRHVTSFRWGGLLTFQCATTHQFYCVGGFVCPWWYTVEENCLLARYLEVCIRIDISVSSTYFRCFETANNFGLVDNFCLFVHSAWRQKLLLQGQFRILHRPIYSKRDFWSCCHSTQGSRLISNMPISSSKFWCWMMLPLFTTC